METLLLEREADEPHDVLVPQPSATRRERTFISIDIFWQEEVNVLFSDKMYARHDENAFVSLLARDGQGACVDGLDGDAAPAVQRGVHDAEGAAAQLGATLLQLPQVDPQTRLAQVSIGGAVGRLWTLSQRLYGGSTSSLVRGQERTDGHDVLVLLA